MRYAAALLEDWMRSYYESAEIDMGSSGVTDYSLREVRRLTGIDTDRLDSIIFGDSPCTGRNDLRELIARKWGNGNPDYVITTHGASEAMYVVLMTILDAGNHVVVLNPAYHSYSSVPESLGCHVSRWQLREELDFEPDLDDLRSIINSRTRAIIVNFPNNPTGVTLTEPQLNDLIAIAADVNAYLVWDAALAELVYDCAPLPDPIKKYERTVSVGTFSKAFGLPGMRFGWCQADPDLIARIVPLRDRITLSISPLLEALAYHVIVHSSRIIGGRLSQAAANRARLVRWADEQQKHVSLVIPQGGVTAFPLLHGQDDTREFCRLLGDKHRLLLVPGLAFDHASRVRLGFGRPTAEFRKGLRLIAEELAVRL